MAYRSERDNNQNPYYPRHGTKEAKPWYKKPSNLIMLAGVILLLILFIMAARGNLRNNPQSMGNQTNSTAELSEDEKLVQYIITQQDAGLRKEEIEDKLQLAGFTQSSIDKGFELADPIVQYIIKELDRGQTKTAIIDTLLAQGIDPNTIKAKVEIATDSRSSSFSKTFKENWLLFLIVAAIIYLIAKKGSSDDEGLAPKIYTLEECREKAEKILTEKSLDFNPTTTYKNRPELKTYRFVFEEPLYPEFNNPKPWGFKAGKRRYYLLSIGYDCELTDFNITFRDSLPREYLESKPSSFERSGATEYMRIREDSEKPISEIKSRQKRFDEEPIYNRKQLKRRYSPGPVVGYEED